MSTDQQLLRLYFEESDNKALETLFARHYPAVFQTVLHLVHNSFDASDIAQATFLRVIQSGRSYRPTGSFRSWILTIAVNEARQSRRRRKRSVREDWLFDICTRPDSGEKRAVTDDACRREFEQKLEVALERMPARLKEPLVLHYYQDLSQAEIGKILGIAKSSVQMRLVGAVKDLKRSFQAGGFGAFVPLIARYIPGVALSGSSLGTILSSAAGKLWIGVLFMKAHKVGLVVTAALFVMIGGFVVEQILFSDDDPSRDPPAPGSVVGVGKIEGPDPIADRSAEPLRREKVSTDPSGGTSARSGIFGRVLDEATAEPIPRATVSVYDYEKDARYSVRTDVEGCFVVKQAEGRSGVFLLKISKDNFAAKTIDYVQPSRESATCLLARGGGIRGRVVTRDGLLPVTSYEIVAVKDLFGKGERYTVFKQLYCQAVPSDMIVEKKLAVNDPSGEFAFTTLSPGKYTLIVNAPGFQPVLQSGANERASRSGRIELTEGETCDNVCIELGSTGLFHVRVTAAETGEPICDARFSIIVNVNRRPILFPCEARLADPGGLYDLPLELNKRGKLARTDLLVTRHGYAPWSGGGFSGQREGHVFPVSLGRGGKVRGTVRDREGRLMEGAAILIEGYADEGLKEAVFTDRNGFYETDFIDVSEQLMLVCLDSALQRIIATVPIKLVNGETLTRNIGCGSVSALFGRVSFMGEPRRGAGLYLRRDGSKQTSGHEESPWREIFLSTGEDGFYRFDNIPPGEYELLAAFLGPDKRSISHKRFLEITEGAKKEVNFHVGCCIEGTVINGVTGQPLITNQGIEISALPVGADAGKESRSTWTDKDGAFALYLDRPAIYELQCDSEEDYFAPEGPRIDLRQERSVKDVAFRIFQDERDGEIVLHVIDAETGESIEEGDCRFWYKRISGIGWFDGGKVEMKQCCLGPWSFLVSSDTHLPGKKSVEITPWEKEVCESIELSRSTAVRVTSVVPGSPAVKAGIEAGDVIRRYAGMEVCNTAELIAAVSDRSADETVRLGIVRRTEEIVLVVSGGKMGIRVENCRFAE